MFLLHLSVGQEDESFTSIRREGAESQFGFPTIHLNQSKEKDEDVVDLTGVRLTTDAFREKKCEKRPPPGVRNEEESPDGEEVFSNLSALPF
jgi:hypothetical protein